MPMKPTTRHAVILLGLLAMLSLPFSAAAVTPPELNDSDVFRMNDAARQGKFDNQFRGRTVEFSGAYIWPGQAGGNPLGLEEWGKQWGAGIRVEQSLMAACRTTATADEEALIREQRYNKWVRAKISGRIASQQYAVLAMRRVIWLEDGCRIDFAVPPLTPEREAAALVLTVPPEVHKAAKILQDGRPIDPKRSPDLLWKAILNDGKVNDAELVLLDRVLNDSGELSLRLPDGSGGFLFRNYWEGRHWDSTLKRYVDEELPNLAKALETEAVKTTLYAELGPFWGADVIDIPSMQARASTGKLQRSLVVKFLGEQFKPLAEVNDGANSWLPLTKAISRAYASIRPLAGEEAKLAKKLLYDGITKARYARDKQKQPKEPPSIFYEWIIKDAAK